MKTWFRPVNPRLAYCALRTVLAGLLAALLPARAPGQLAITEVLSSPFTMPGADYWELTNFGTDHADLEAYWFADETGFGGALNLADLAEDEDRFLGPGESIVFVRGGSGEITNAADFRRWWGDTNLPAGLRLATAGWDFGLSSERDAVQLWEVTVGQTTRVDRVELPDADRGVSFTYDPATGLLNTLSARDMKGAFHAATSPDVGSPGVTTGPVPLRVVRAPAGSELDGGMPFTFSVEAHGLPRPRYYQWHFNGNAIAGAGRSTFTITNAGPADAGEYTVEVSNGLTNVVAGPAMLNVNGTPSCARIVRGPAGVTVTPGQTAIFRVEVRGFPLPEIQWRFNDTPIPGEAKAVLAVSGANESDEGIYTVFVANSVCSTNASARLKVVPRPKLVITEAMANPSTNTAARGHDSWWELTNMDTQAVSLVNYRFDDKPGLLEGAVVVTTDITLQPSQSMIWVSSMTPEKFRRWWGEENLPMSMPIVAYPGNGFSRWGDMIRLWNATALEAQDWIASLSFVNLEDGISLWFDPLLAEFGELSVEGERGAFRAAESDDIGSPGWLSNEQRVVRPRITSVLYDASEVTLTWNARPDRTYELQYCHDLTIPEWRTLFRLTAHGDSLSATDYTAGAAASRFYRVLLLPAGP